VVRSACGWRCSRVETDCSARSLFFFPSFLLFSFFFFSPVPRRNRRYPDRCRAVATSPLLPHPPPFFFFFLSLIGGIVGRMVRFMKLEAANRRTPAPSPPLSFLPFLFYRSCGNKARKAPCRSARLCSPFSSLLFLFLFSFFLFSSSSENCGGTARRKLSRGLRGGQLDPPFPFFFSPLTSFPFFPRGLTPAGMKRDEADRIVMMPGPPLFPPPFFFLFSLSFPLLNEVDIENVMKDNKILGEIAAACLSPSFFFPPLPFPLGSRV